MVLWRYREVLVRDGQELDIPWNAEHVKTFQDATDGECYCSMVCWLEPVESKRKPYPIPEYEEILREIEENTVVCDLCKKTFVSMDGEHLCPNCDRIAERISTEREVIA